MAQDGLKSYLILTTPSNPIEGFGAGGGARQAGGADRDLAPCVTIVVAPNHTQGGMMLTKIAKAKACDKSSGGK